MQDQAIAPAVLEVFARALSAAGFGASLPNDVRLGLKVKAGSGPADSGEKKFYSVAQVADMFGISEMGIYRAIHAGKFPAVRIGLRRYFVPARAIEAMAEAAMARGLVDAADWAATPATSVEGVA